MNTLTKNCFSLVFAVICSLNVYAISTSLWTGDAEKAVLCPNGEEDVTGTYKLDFIICAQGYRICGDAEPGGKFYLEKDLKGNFYCTPATACPGQTACTETLLISYFDGSTECEDVTHSTGERATTDKCNAMDAWIMSGPEPSGGYYVSRFELQYSIAGIFKCVCPAQ